MSGRRNTEVKLVARTRVTLVRCTVVVDVQDELEGFGELPGAGAEQTRGQQRPHVVGTSPGQWAARVMNGLEVEPVWRLRPDDRPARSRPWRLRG